MSYIDSIKKLEVNFKQNLEKIRDDISHNQIYKDIEQVHYLKLTEIVGALNKGIQASFMQMNSLSAELEDLMAQISSSSTSLELANDKLILSVEYKETMERVNSIFNETESQIRLLESPFFGILTLDVNGHKTIYYIGKNAVVDENMSVLSSDWRSSIGKSYYNAQEKGEKCTLHSHNKEGDFIATVISKELLTFRDGTLVSYSDLLDDKYSIRDVLSKDLAERKGGRFKDIISTIQKDQDAIIRLDANIPISIQGCAGSGKTSIAVHRLSHIFFNFEENRVDPLKTVYITPNKLFSDYLQDVETALGLDGTQFLTYLGWGTKILFSTTEPISKETHIHPKLINDALQYEFDYDEINKTAQEYVRRNIIELTTSTLEQLTRDFEETSHFNELLQFANTDFNIKKLLEFTTEVLSLTKGLDGDLRRGFIDFLRNSELFPLFEAACTELKYKTAFKTNLQIELPENRKSLYVHFSIHDLPALLMLRDYIYKRGDVVNQMLVIDEAQNYSSSQIHSMLQYVHRNKISVIGDIHQQTNPHGITNLSLKASPMKDFVDAERIHSTIVRSCYRTTKGIMEASYKPFGDMLKRDLSANHYFREGDEVEIIHKDKAEDVLANVANQACQSRHNTIAVVSSHSILTEIRESYADTESLSDFDLLQIGENNYRKGIFFLEPEDLTGLEFDTILYLGNLKEIEEYKDWQTASKLHVIMSRALHKLVLYDLGDE